MIRRRARDGYTIVELMIGVFLALIVVLALGRIILANQRSWEWGRDKTVLQANSTEALEWMSRQVRAARRIEIVSASEFRTYDENDALAHTYRRAVVSGEGRLQQDGASLVGRPCTAFAVAGDSANVTMRLELQDKSGNKVSATTRATVRNRSFEY
jgi:Tfp pilus assembly protein PilW